MQLVLALALALPLRVLVLVLALQLRQRGQNIDAWAMEFVLLPLLKPAPFKQRQRSDSI